MIPKQTHELSKSPVCVCHLPTFKCLMPNPCSDSEGGWPPHSQATQSRSFPLTVAGAAYGTVEGCFINQVPNSTMPMMMRAFGVIVSRSVLVGEPDVGQSREGGKRGGESEERDRGRREEGTGEERGDGRRRRE